MANKPAKIRSRTKVRQKEVKAGRLKFKGKGRILNLVEGRGGWEGTWPLEEKWLHSWQMKNKERTQGNQQLFQNNDSNS